jgi:hypothetical protein
MLVLSKVVTGVKVQGAGETGLQGCGLRTVCGVQHSKQWCAHAPAAGLSLTWRPSGSVSLRVPLANSSSFCPLA